MNSLLAALHSKEGKKALIGMVVGIIIACGGGYLVQDNDTLCDIVVIAGSIFSMVGAEQFCRLIIRYREELGEE